MRRRCSVFLFFLACSYGYSQNSINKQKLIQDLRILSADSMEGRKVGTEGSKKARSLIVDRLERMGVKPFNTSYVHSFPINESSVSGSNILGVIEGKKKETIVISAHYDHVGIIRNVIYNGADDNASGTSALLAYAEYFKNNPPEHRLIFAFFDAEEIGLKGSEHFVNSIDLEREKIVLNVNMDMISRSDRNELFVCGTFHYPMLLKPIQSIQLPQNFKLRFGHDNPAYSRQDWTNQSDQKNFHIKKIPFLYFGVEDHPDYHQSTDDFEKINTEFYSNSAEAILRAIKALDENLE